MVPSWAIAVISEKSHIHGSAKLILAIVGPTASGKSAVAQLVAQQLDALVLSADSMQIYKGMDIGTGKVMPCDRIVEHRGLDLIDPGEPFSAALYQEYARSIIGDRLSAGLRTVLCGGTGFYVRAALDDFDFPAGEQVGNILRDKLNEFAASEGAHALWLRLYDKDPDSAEIIPENDVKRVIRAFELLESGESYARQKQRFAMIRPYYDALYIGLAVDPVELNKRIDARVDNMIEQGLIAEVEGLLAKGFREGVTAPSAIGYKEIVSALDGKITIDEAIGQIKVATHRYAKRQRTWFRKDKRIHWLDATHASSEELGERALELYKSLD